MKGDLLPALKVNNSYKKHEKLHNFKIKSEICIWWDPPNTKRNSLLYQVLRICPSLISDAFDIFPSTLCRVSPTTIDKHDVL